MRHAKAEPFAATDHERRLTNRGAGDAADAGRHLASSGWVPDHAVVSSATRTVATWEAVRDATGAQAVVEVDDEVYNGSPHVVLAALRAVPTGATTLMFVGHSPTAPYLAHFLDDSEGDPGAVNALLGGFPTSALAIFEVEVPWTDLGEGDGRLVDYYVGRS